MGLLPARGQGRPRPIHSVGGFNIGELFGALRLDNSQYLEALAQSQQAGAAMAINTAEIGDSVNKLARELSQAGFRLNEMASYFKSLVSQGLSSSEAVEELVRSIQKLQ